MARKKADHSRPKTLSESAPWKNKENFLRKMITLTDKLSKEYQETGKMTLPSCDYDGRSVPVMEGNSKTGALRSVSMRPVLDCGNCSKCSGSCYDLRHDVTNNACMEYRCATAVIYQHDNERFWKEIEAHATVSSLWRYNIGGDIIDKDYLQHVVIIAMKSPHCKFLLFTKMYDLVNEWISEFGEFPENLHVIFSMWPGVEMHNPHQLPVSFPVYAEKDIKAHEYLAEFDAQCPKFYWKCNDNCTECALNDQGCFKLGRGEAVGFNYH